MNSARALSHIGRSACVPGVLGHCGATFFGRLAVLDVFGR